MTARRERRAPAGAVVPQDGPVPRLLSDPKLGDEITRRIAAGSTKTAAARDCGVTDRAVRRWVATGDENLAAIEDAIERGEEPPPRHEPYASFAEAYARAEARSVLGLVAAIRRAAQGTGDVPGDWRAAAYLLERLYPDAFGRPGQTAGQVGQPFVQVGVAVDRRSSPYSPDEIMVGVGVALVEAGLDPAPLLAAIEARSDAGAPSG